MKFIESLPACPVETTLMLIGDKWKVSDLMLTPQSSSILCYNRANHC